MPEIIDRREKRNPIIDEVNPLIEEAFGRGFKGNYNHAHLSLVDGPEGLKEVNYLCLIGRKFLRGFLCEVVGQLGSERAVGGVSDGSVIAVFPEFKEKALKYARLYEEVIGGPPVRVIVTDNLNPGDNPLTLR